MAAKKKTDDVIETNDSREAKASEVLREPAEIKYAVELEALRQNDEGEAPAPWLLSPRSVLAYVTGTKKPLKATIDGKTVEVPITRKFFGDDTIVERSIVTLASERALLLVGDPGTGKSWLSEHLAAAICGNSTLTIQGTAGTTEEQIKYSWNIARIIAEGPKPENMIASPCMIAMRGGKLFRFEEITRCVGDVQDALVSICSDKAIAVPELPGENMVFARPGFNIIATANSRDQGVNELSAALKRRFNYVHIPVVADQKTEVEIVGTRSAELLARYRIPAKVEKPVLDLLATVFRELREGVTSDGVKVQKPTTTLSTAEAIGVALDAAIHSRHFGSGIVGPAEVGRNLVGSVVKEDLGDVKVLKEYLNLVVKKRAATDTTWKAFHDAATQSLKG
ncbi:MOXR-like ATPase [Labilithrix luteola]|uniref:MOXR-like ATPase n=1 Tax=Labilithrix luteola TaxID=1391654 RepID=A0A0K1PKM0_9BACT|nr:AAA family ATPase [Labilithrix luteola]AKU93941.1 MOXR-like ATPase [Labilithrix luteola]